MTNKTHTSSVLILTAFIIALFLPALSHAQTNNKVVFTTIVKPELDKAVKNALSKKLDYFYNEYSYMPYLHYSMVDLNADGKSEIIVRFAEEWDFRDRFNNVDTHIFTQTRRGLKEIFFAQTSDLEIGSLDRSGLRKINVYKNPNTRRLVEYVWDKKQNKYREANG